MSRSVTGSLLRSKNQELVVANYLRIHGETTYIPKDIIGIIILYFIRFDFIFSKKIFTRYLSRENKTCWINEYCLLKCCIDKQSNSCCIFSIETEKISQLIKHISMQLHLYCNEVSKSWIKRFQVGQKKRCIQQTLFDMDGCEVKTLNVLWNTKLISIVYKPNTMIYKDDSNAYILNIDTKEKLEWLITGVNAKHKLFVNNQDSNSDIKQIYWYQNTFYFQLVKPYNHKDITIKFIINLFNKQKTFDFQINKHSKPTIPIRFNQFESLYYKLKALGKSDIDNIVSKKKKTFKAEQKIYITFNEKPYGFSIREGEDGCNAILKRIKTTQYINLKKGLYIYRINDIPVDNKPFSEIRSLLIKSIPPINIVFSKHPPKPRITISSRYTAMQLIDGYIHKVEYKSFNSNIIIPQVISQICFQFYFTSMFIYCFISNSDKYNHNHLHIADINDSKKKTLKSFECNIFCLTEPECIESGIDNPFPPLSFGLCRANNLKFSQSVNNQLINNYKSFESVKYYQDSPNIVLFKIGGTFHDQPIDQCYGIILTDSQFILKKEEEQSNSVKEIDAFSWRLPPLPTPMQNVSVCFSDRKQSLFCIGGDYGSDKHSNKIYRLSFEEIKNKNWLDEKNIIQWEQITQMRQRRANAASCFVGNGDNKLLVVTGVNGYTGNNRYTGNILDSGEIYDFTSGIWSKIKDVPFGERYGAGICYDRVSNRAYLGGGYCVGSYSDYVVWYDIYKDCWYTDLQVCRYKHIDCPVLWVNNNILCIMSANSKSIEYLDLRVNGCWNKMSKNYLLRDTLGVECDADQCRLFV
eukprot:417618_1